MTFYIESSDRPRKSRLPAEDIPVGTLVAEDGTGHVELAEQATGHFDGVADNPLTGEQVREYEDAPADPNWYVYETAEDERVVYGGDADRDMIKVKTAADNGVDPAASVSDGTVVGLIPNGAEFHGRVVEEDYTDEGDTTYGRSSTGDFLAVGKVYKDEENGFDEPVRIEVRRDL